VVSRQQAGIGGLYNEVNLIDGCCVCSVPVARQRVAALTPFQLFTGTVGVSSDGWGSTTQSGVISANVPFGATVTAAYLYTSTFDNGALTGVGGTIAAMRSARSRTSAPTRRRAAR
jgi:hypothetical protein